ncbi:MAG: flavin prenyltransferase UbiX, partial [Pseudomonadota bacterium]
APYALKLLQKLLEADYHVFLMISSAAKVVLATENNIKLPSQPEKTKAFLYDVIGIESGNLTLCGKEEWFSPVASGSAAPKQMIVCPCSTGTLSAIATGASDNLIERAADVVLKEKGQLILVPREMPLSTIHLRNMLTLSEMGATIMPAAPGFYHEPKSIEDLVEFVVARILDHVGVDQSMVARWGYQNNNK